MRLIIHWAGNMRSWSGISKLLDGLPSRPDCILIGSIHGLGPAIEEWAADANVSIEHYLLTQYTMHGDKAIWMRNQSLIDAGDVLLLVWDGRDQDCRQMMMAAIDVGIKCLQFNPFMKNCQPPVVRITMKEVLELKKKALNAGSGPFNISVPMVLSLIDAIERRDHVIKKLGNNEKNQ